MFPVTLNDGFHSPDAADATGMNAVESAAIAALTASWRDHPACNPLIEFQSWAVPSLSTKVGASSSKNDIQCILNSTSVQPYLASRLANPLNHLHVRFKLVRDVDTISVDTSIINTDTTTANNPTTPATTTTTTTHRQKLILLHPDTPPIAELPLAFQQALTHNEWNIGNGPVVPVQFHYHQFTASFLLEQLLPPSVHPVPTAFETVGHVAHLNLKSHHMPYSALIGQVLVETLPAIETVLCKVGEVSGPYRTYQIRVMAGRPDTAVQLVESGVSLQFDLSLVYWCSRLSEERQRLLRDEIFAPPQMLKNVTNRSEEIKAVDDKAPDGKESSSRVIIVADAFCGVGALCLQAAAAAATPTSTGPHFGKTNKRAKPALSTPSSSVVEIWANDWNPHAVEALRENAARNNLMESFTRVSCGDAYEFIMDLGMQVSPASSPSMATTATAATTPWNETPDRLPNRDRQRRRPKASVVRLPDHVVMNFPLKAPQFLGALRWWPSDTGVVPRVHVYTFARLSLSSNETAEDVAVNLIAEQLLPTTTTTTNGRRILELNDEYNCRVRVHPVRDVAPGKSVFCVSFSVTSKLLRHMRGNFS